MPAERVTMRQAREIIRLKFSVAVATREIARRLGRRALDRSGDVEALRERRASWPLPDGLSDGDLEAALYANRRSKRGHRRTAEPDWPAMHRELKRKHVTLLIVWDEYIAEPTQAVTAIRGSASSIAPWKRSCRVTMRQTHAAGERLFVDYAGDGVPVVIDRLTGEIRKAQIFVAVLGRIELHFCAGDLDAGAARLDRRPCPGLRSDRRRAAASRAGQHQDRRHQGLPLRSAGQSHLRRDGGALRHRHSAGAAAEAAGQGQGRAGGADRRAMASGAAAPPALLQPGRGQRGDRRTADASQRGAPDPPARRDAPAIARRDRRPALKASAGRALQFCEWRVCRVGIDYHVESAAIITACPIASPAPRSRCG